jgi:hypothetical protein
MGEFVAWIIGWDLVLEYRRRSDSGHRLGEYFNRVLEFVGMASHAQWRHSPFGHGRSVGRVNIPAVVILAILSAL